MKSAIRLSRADRVFYICNNVFLGLCLFIVGYPLIYIISSSFSAPTAVVAGKVILWPVELSLEGYKAVFDYRLVWTGYLNSLIYMTFGTTINVAITVLAAYPLSRKDLFGKSVITFIFMFTMFFNGGLIPTYIQINNLGLINTRWAMILPSALAIWNMIIMRTYFQTSIGDELREAAALDGCNDYIFLLRIVLPLSGAILAVIALFYAVGHWNSFFDALVYLRSQQLYPLQIFLRDILILNSADNNMLMDAKEAEIREAMRELLKYSLIIVASVPVMCLYPFVQKYFVKGVMVGAIKG